MGRRIAGSSPAIAATCKSACSVVVTHVIEQGEQKPTDNQFTPEQASILDKHIDKLVEQKPAWSEEDDIFFKAIIRDIENIQYISENAKKDRISWLKSLKERVQPQPKQEWSEEDIVAIDCAVEVLSKDLSSLAASIERIKSIRSQNMWKSIDEHYELEEFAKIVRGNLTGISKAVQELFEAKYLQLTGNKMYGGYRD